VPLIVPLAWTMMAYPCLLLGRRLAGSPALRRAPRRLVTVGLGAATLAAWDLYLDPQMVAAGHWTWHHPEPGLPGVPGIPLTNHAGWLLVAVVMVAALDVALPEHGTVPGEVAGEAVPAALLAWTWLGSAVGNLAFFGRPAVAGYGVIAMGLTVLPYLRLLLAARSREARR
jgi:putative membrane protein